jgi:CheY-like chemotaxis protein
MKPQLTTLILNFTLGHTAIDRHILDKDDQYEYRIIEAQSEQEALALYLQFLPDVILVSLSELTIDELTFLDQLKTQVQSLPTIVLVAEAEEVITAVRSTGNHGLGGYELSTIDKLCCTIHRAIDLTHQLKENQEQQHLIEEIKQLNADLELRVEQRTLELTQSNNQLIEEVAEHRRTEIALGLQIERLNSSGVE